MHLASYRLMAAWGGRGVYFNGAQVSSDILYSYTRPWCVSSSSAFSDILVHPQSHCQLRDYLNARWLKPHHYMTFKHATESWAIDFGA